MMPNFLRLLPVVLTCCTGAAMAASSPAGGSAASPGSQAAASRGAAATRVEKSAAAAPVDWEAVAKSLGKNRAWQAGRQALKKGLADQAVVQFGKALNDKKLSADQSTVVKAALGEAYVRAGQPARALETLAGLPAGAASPYWKGAALAALGRLTEAVPLLLEVGLNDPVCGVSSRQLLAEAAWRLNREELLLPVLDELIAGGKESVASRARLAKAEWLLDHGKTEGVADLLKAVSASPEAANSQSSLGWSAELLSLRLAAFEGEFTKALELSRKLGERKKLTPLQRDTLRLEQSSLYGLMERSEGAPGTAPAADDEEDVSGKSEELLVHLISTTPDSPLLAEAFRRLEAAQAFANPLVRAKLIEWTRAKHPKRTPLALLYMARVLQKQGMTGEALACVQFAAANYANTEAAQLLVQQGVRWLLENGRRDEAAPLLQQLTTPTQRSLFERGALAYADGRFGEAAAAFDEAMLLSDDLLYAPAAENACLAALRAGSADEVEKLLRRAEETPAVHASLLYTRARFLAFSRDPGAEQALKTLMTLYPDAPETELAKLDLASLCLSYAPKRAARYLDDLAAETTSSWSPENRWRLAALRIEVAEAMQESGEDWKKPEDLAAAALKESFPADERARLHMKLASILFAGARYAEALEAMGRFLKSDPGSPYEGAALYLAAQSAEHLHTPEGLQKAMKLYAACAAGGSTFAVPAAIAEASVAIRLAHPEEALKLLDELLATRRLGDVDRAWVLVTKADAYAASADEKSGLQQARALCSEALSLANLPAAWRYRILMQRARLAEKLGDIDDALADYRTILTADPSALPSPKRKDWYWYNAAGFASVDLLLKKGDYAAAVALAEDMGRKPGTRAREAAEWARRIRLEHFVWDAPEK